METSLIEQLEAALASKDVTRRAAILRKVTDLFVVGSGKFNDDQIELFDDVMSRLLDNIEHAVRVQFGDRIARIPDAPPRVVRTLAFHDAIEVAGPVLEHSERLEPQTLVEVAKAKGQDHLLAISGRKILPEDVTDVLVERGNKAVVVRTVRNAGAAFSALGMSSLVEKARSDDDLALRIWSRPDIPRQDLVKLFVDVSEAVKGQLEEADPRRVNLIRAAMTEASARVQADARIGSDDFAQAETLVKQLHASGLLDESQLSKFAGEASFDKVTVALSLLADLPLGSVERVFVQQQTDQIIVLARALDLSWATTVALLLLQAGANGSSRQQLDVCFANFSRLQSRTAQTALQFYRLREKAVGTSTQTSLQPGNGYRRQ
ncbi:DUF2336 domain-containing protein [Bradyrhizobium manausense]|uniref:DUF2336 domain-containing protein n=1 Tax=Bradyrhizobium manausense TaxID=989370 RepID=UPI001BA4718A|nr:DUF2336 domain-containing protein [Bradyrhizobium manausense]MBR1088547.1 DUF2336 domain-containing protein [Bradyrhizobium manausense]